jgi:hypothetical protein
MMMKSLEQSMECELAVETEVQRKDLPQSHNVCQKSRAAVVGSQQLTA